MLGSGVLVVGESLVDITGTEAIAHPGGSPLNVAVGLARLGQCTTLATQLGDDAYGDVVSAHLAASGAGLVRLAPVRPTGSATVRVDADGQAAYRFNLRWDPEPLEMPAGHDLLHVGSLGSTLAPGAETVAQLVGDARQAGVAVSVDPNVRPTLTPDVSDVRRRVLHLAGLAQVVKLSEDDAAVLFPGRTADDVLGDLLAAGPDLVALTRGSAGAQLATASARTQVTARRVRVVDTIGAGDSFMAALLAVLREQGWTLDRLDAADLAEVGGFACRAAGMTCGRRGADPPRRIELPGSSGSALSGQRSYPGR